ncbi:tripartite motif-containing protein 16-like protein isoform X1 [Dicentrarchus labrax]|nr:tripartite motif-containing protein 16-like protein isoform X1 [Dicentrarchus labrax]
MPARPNSTIVLSETKKTGKKVKSNKNEMTKREKVPVYVPNIPEPTSRAELMKHWMNLTLDDKTANKMLWISDSGSKVCRRTEEVCPVLDRPERYEYSPQVVCKEAIWNMRAYWEVVYSGWAVIGAAYEGAGRRAHSGPSGLGENEESWGLCWSGTRYQIWFNGMNKDINGVPQCSTIGVYIDQPAGIISFYVVTGEGAEQEVQLLHKIKTSIEKNILPGFWMGIQSSCTILKRPE